MQNTATITICEWKLKLLRMETLALTNEHANVYFQPSLCVIIMVFP